MARLTITNALVPEGGVTTVCCDGGVVVAIGDPIRPGDTVLDAQGRIVLPAPAEPHAHLDKAFLAALVPNPTGDLMGAIEGMHHHRALLTRAGTAVRAERAARCIAAHGATAIRTHVDVTTGNGLDSVEALVDVRDRLRDVVTIQIVALCGFPSLGLAGADQRALLRGAIDLGVDAVGGCPHLESDPAAATALFLSVAADAGLPVDLHTDETLRTDALGVVDLAEQVVATGFPHGVTASHCVSLGMLAAVDQRRIAEAIAEAGISVIALPASNLFLQGRDHPTAMPRGLTAVAALRAGGVNVAAGWDNLQDPFNPVGRGDCLETAALMVMAAHALPHEALHMVTNASRRAMGLRDAGPTVGAVADLVLLPHASTGEAVAAGGHGAVVVRGGVAPSPAGLPTMTG